MASENESDGKYRPLYGWSDRIKHAFLVEHGPLIITYQHCPPDRIVGEGLIVGTYEHLIAESGGQPWRRCCQVEIPVTSTVHLIEFSTVKAMAEQFRFGYHSNRFLAAQLESANRSFVTALHSVPEQEQNYLLRARLYAQIVNDLRRVGAQLGLLALTETANAFATREIFNAGSTLVLEERYAAMSLAPISVAERVERLPAGTILCTQGAEESTMYVLLDGRVAILVDGRCVAVVNTPGEAFGEMALLRDGKRTASVVVESGGCAVARVERTGLPDFHATHPDLFWNLSLTLARRISKVLEGLRAVQATGTPERNENETRQRRRRARKDFSELIESFEKFTKKFTLAPLDQLWNHYAEQRIQVAVDEKGP